MDAHGKSCLAIRMTSCRPTFVRLQLPGPPPVLQCNNPTRDKVASSSSHGYTEDVTGPPTILSGLSAGTSGLLQDRQGTRIDAYHPRGSRMAVAQARGIGPKSMSVTDCQKPSSERQPAINRLATNCPPPDHGVPRLCHSDW